MESAQAIHQLLHTLWTKAVGTDKYDKEEWKRLSAFIYANIDVTKLNARNQKGPEFPRPSRYDRKPVI
jgi:hypothetical protein